MIFVYQLNCYGALTIFNSFKYEIFTIPDLRIEYRRTLKFNLFVVINSLMRVTHLEFQYLHQIHLVLVNCLLIVFLAIWKLVLTCLVY